jgi:hypothetical protein
MQIKAMFRNAMMKQFGDPTKHGLNLSLEQVSQMAIVYTLGVIEGQLALNPLYGIVTAFATMDMSADDWRADESWCWWIDAKTCVPETFAEYVRRQQSAN